MTEEQYKRAEIIHELRRTMSPEWMQMQYRDLPALPTSDHFWMHFTDIPMRKDINFYDVWLKERLIERDLKIEYQPRGDWMDHFPPRVYKLTIYGKRALEESGEYVFAEGLFK